MRAVLAKACKPLYTSRGHDGALGSLSQMDYYRSYLRLGDPRGNSGRASMHRPRALGGSYLRWPYTTPCARGEHGGGAKRNVGRRDAAEVSVRCATLHLGGRRGWGKTSERLRPCHCSGFSAWTCTETAPPSSLGSCIGAHLHHHLCHRDLFGTVRRLRQSHRGLAHPPSFHRIGSVTLSLSDLLRLFYRQLDPSIPWSHLGHHPQRHHHSRLYRLRLLVTPFSFSS